MKILPKGSKVIVGFPRIVQEHKFRDCWFSFPCFELQTHNDCELINPVFVAKEERTNNWDSCYDVWLDDYKEEFLRILFNSNDVIEI